MKKKNKIYLIIVFLFIMIAFIFAGDNVDLFQHDCMTLTLSENWSLKEISAGFDKSTIGWLNWNKDNNSSILIFSYKGPIYDYNNMRIKGLKILQENYPLSQKMIQSPKKIETSGSGRTTVELWLGSVSVDGQNITLQSPMAIIKNKNCWIIMIGFAPEKSGESFYNDFIELIKTVK